MPSFEYSKWDGSQPFSPQSADKVFDQISDYLLQYGDDALQLFEELEQQSPELLDQLIQRGLVEKDAEGKFQVTPKGVRRVESKALEELFDVTRKDRTGRHETDQRGQAVAEELAVESARHAQVLHEHEGHPRIDFRGHAGEEGFERR